MNTQQLNRQQTEEKYKALKNNFFKRGILIGGMSGLLYGVYSAFLTLGMSRGIWADCFHSDLYAQRNRQLH